MDRNWESVRPEPWKNHTTDLAGKTPIVSSTVTQTSVPIALMPRAADPGPWALDPALDPYSPKSEPTLLLPPRKNSSQSLTVWVTRSGWVSGQDQVTWHTRYKTNRGRRDLEHCPPLRLTEWGIPQRKGLPMLGTLKTAHVPCNPTWASSLHDEEKQKPWEAQEA